MIRNLLIVCACLFGITPPSIPNAIAQRQSNSASNLVSVLMQTELGDIEIQLEVKRAPITSRNFLRYVDAGHYDGGRFHRTVRLKPDNQPANAVKIEVIQAGVNPEKARDNFGPIKLERTNVTGLKHKDGVISMARAFADTATSDFFICIGDQPELDFGGRRNSDGQGFAAFGKVIKGMDVVRRIHQSSFTDQRLTPPIRIIGAKRLK
ncbi:MAG: peptidylprolyl isomerase [Blastocatellales bacterium]